MIRKKYASPCSAAKLKINKNLSKTMKLLSYSTKANVSKNRFAKNLVYHHLISKTWKITGRLIIEDFDTITDLFTSLLAKVVRKIITIKQ